MNYQRWVIFLFSGIVFVLAAGFGWWWWKSLGYVTTDDARVKAEIVAVSAEIPGRVSFMPKREGDPVRRRETVARLDRRELELQLEQAQADLERLRSRAQQAAREIELHLARQREEIQQTEASLRGYRFQLDDARAHLTQAEEDWRRNQTLFSREMVAAQDLDHAKTKLRQAEAQVSAAREKIKEAQSGLDLVHIKSKQTAVMEADLQARRAEVKRAESIVADLRRKLDLTTVASPVEGVIVKKNVHAGEVIQVGQPIVMVVDSSRFWVEANIDETEIRYVAPGSPVKIKVDSYPDREFDGKVIEIISATVSEFSLFTPQKLTGQFIKSTQRLPVKISVENSNGLLKVGMLAVVQIKKSAR